MSSLAQVVSEIAHSVKQPNNKALRENIKLLVIQVRNELVRHTYEQHGYVDKGLTQRYKVSLTDVADGELVIPEDLGDIDITYIKRTLEKVPRPVRLTNNLPFDRVSSVGFKTNIEFPYIKETTARFRNMVPGLKGIPCYDYINEYIYLFPTDCNPLNNKKIIIESAFEHPTYIQIKNGEIEHPLFSDDDEYLMSEDMVGQIKDIIYKRDLLTQPRETNELPNTIKY